MPDEQGFFPNITNQNECMALNCELRWQCSDCCWIWDQSWEQVTVSCELNSPFGLHNFGPGCYCQTYGVLTVHECCLRPGAPRSLWHGSGYIDGSDCTSDLESREHPCNNIEGITEDTNGNPLLPPTEKTKKEPGCGYDHYIMGIIKRILLKSFDTRWVIWVFFLKLLKKSGTD